MNSDNNPVWTVYDRLCTTRLNVKYYSCRLQKIERWNFWLELILLMTAPTSAVAGLWFWDFDLGKIIWKYLGVIAAFIAVIKPLLTLPKRMKDYESVLSGYRCLDYDLMRIKSLIEQKRKYDKTLQDEFKKAMQREESLVSKSPETKENVDIKRQCQREVVQELPADRFFIPEE